MDDTVPQKLQIAAVTQIVSGFLSGFTACFGSMFIGTVCGIASCGFGGQFCGLISWLLVPIGMIEIGVGIFGLLNPKEAAGPMRIVSFVEMGAILLGGITNAIAGGIVFAMLGNEEVTGYLEG